VNHEVLVGSAVRVHGSPLDKQIAETLAGRDMSWRRLGA
jgi:hypothetical protein